VYDSFFIASVVFFYICRHKILENEKKILYKKYHPKTPITMRPMGAAHQSWRATEAGTICGRVVLEHQDRAGAILLGDRNMNPMSANGG
jgi:hypothetical protein